VHVASINTKTMTELCVLSMHRYAGFDYELVVGDCGSTDGSLEMLRELEQRKVLTLEVAPDGRAHGEWLDRWFALCPARYAVFVDSDVEFLREQWLHDMVETATTTGAALVATRIQARNGVQYKHPTTGSPRVLAPRPEPWLMLIDVEQTRGVVLDGFAYRDEPPTDGGAKTAFDIGAAFFRGVERAGLLYAEMPPEFARAYRHYGGMSWQRMNDRGMPFARRMKQGAKAVQVRSHLRRARRASAISATTR
jgi:glycosyltransferase involved in cell wall biosynthesis